LVNAPALTVTSGIYKSWSDTPVEVLDLNSHKHPSKAALTKKNNSENMIFVFLLLLIVFSFSADSRQQDMLGYRSRPYNPRLPHFSSDRDVVCLGLRDWADMSTNCNNDAAELLKVIL